jgi:putative methyltransferase
VNRRWVYLAQVAHRFGPNAFLPYSAGRLWAYAQAKAPIIERYALGELLWDREPIEKVIRRMHVRPPDVLGLSTYIWNEQYNLAFAAVVKSEFPRCLIVMGGPQVPQGKEGQDYLREHDYVDTLVLGEGEETFAQLLREWGIDDDGLPLLPGTTSRWHIGAPQNVKSLSDLASPYLDDSFEYIMRRTRGVQWQALQETDRGCPYQCTFCVWGAASLNDVRTFPLDTLKRELEWMSEHGIEICYNCDANFAMLPHHEQFADCLMEVSARTGYPKKFRAAYAKKITERVFRVAKKLSDADLSKGATISFQSMDSQVLGAVKRLNPVAKSLAATFDRYNDAGIPTYSELILGLPGETMDSFKSGLDALLDAGQHQGLAVYPCMMLRNSELADPVYRELHGLKIRRVQQLLLHGTPQPGDIPEWYDLVVETSTLKHEEWRLAWELGAVIQALHCTGVTDQLAKIAHARGVKYTDFYLELIGQARRGCNRSSPLATELRWFGYALDRALAGKEWPTVMNGFGSVQWPMEEALLLRLLLRRNTLFLDFGEWLRQWVTLDEVEAQKQAAPDPEQWDSLEEFAREAIWYGRKGRKLRHTNPHLSRMTDTQLRAAIAVSSESSSAIER